MDMIERVAKAIYDATDPLSGDPIATLVHVSDHLFWDGVDPEKEMTDLERQLEGVRIVCRAAAIAALKALREPTSEMVEAGADAWTEGVAGYGIKTAFTAMIDTALAGEGKGE